MGRFGGLKEWLVVLAAVALFFSLDYFGEALCALLFPVGQ